MKFFVGVKERFINSFVMVECGRLGEILYCNREDTEQRVQRSSLDCLSCSTQTEMNAEKPQCIAGAS